MQELIALLKQEKDIKLLIEQEKMKQTRLEKTFHEQNTTIYKNNSVLQEQIQKKQRLSQQQMIYENANEKYHLKQKQYVQFMHLIQSHFINSLSNDTDYDSIGNDPIYWISTRCHFTNPWLLSLSIQRK